MLMVTGPNGPFTNIPPTIETHVEFISDAIARAQKNKGRDAIIEVTREAESGWTGLCNELSKDSLFRKSPSWIFGANVGKAYSSLFFFGGLKDYRRRMKEIVDGDYVGFKKF